MATRTADSGMMSEWWRLGGIAGIAWIVLFAIGGFVLQGETPSRDDSIADIRQYFVDDGEMYLAGDFILAIAFLFFFLPFVVVLSRVLRGDDSMSQALSTLIVVGGLAGTLWGGVAGATWGALAVGAAGNPEVDDSAVRMMMELDTYAFAQLGLPVALFLAAASLAIWRSGALWRWLAIIGGIAAVMLVIGSAWPIDGDEEGAIAIVGFIGFPITVIFVLIASIGLIMRKSEPA